MIRKYVYSATTTNNADIGDPNTTRVVMTKSFHLDYPTMDDVLKMISNRVSVSSVVDALSKAGQGVGDLKLINLEEEWYEYCKDIEVIEADIIKTNLELTNLKTMEQTIEIKLAIQGIIGYTATPTNDEPYQVPGELDKLEIRLSEAKVIRDNFEVTHPWLKTNRDNTVTILRPTIVSEVPLDVKKVVVAYKRDIEVRDMNDTISDLAKMNALLMSMATGIYSVLSDDQKAMIPPEKRGLTEYAINKWMNSSTRADRQLASEGVSLIERLFDNEVKIADIVDDIYAIGN